MFQTLGAIVAGVQAALSVEGLLASAMWLAGAA